MTLLEISYLILFVSWWTNGSLIPSNKVMSELIYRNYYRLASNFKKYRASVWLFLPVHWYSEHNRSQVNFYADLRIRSSLVSMATSVLWLFLWGLVVQPCKTWAVQHYWYFENSPIFQKDVQHCFEICLYFKSRSTLLWNLPLFQKQLNIALKIIGEFS